MGSRTMARPSLAHELALSKSKATCETHIATVSSARDNARPLRIQRSTWQHAVWLPRKPSNRSWDPSKSLRLVPPPTLKSFTPSDKYITTSTSNPKRSTSGPTTHPSPSEMAPTDASMSPMTGATSGRCKRCAFPARSSVRRHLRKLRSRRLHPDALVWTTLYEPTARSSRDASAGSHAEPPITSNTILNDASSNGGDPPPEYSSSEFVRSLKSKAQ
mmetsp:Transcript_32416/g.89607  ORF Transcript_32416/g.89607 Transcript_32416/m.89607 type:complete len:217 (-) Transcript_32416:738-1388(-)